MSSRRAQVAMEYVLVLTGIIVVIIVVLGKFVKPRVENMSDNASKQGQMAVENYFKVGNM